MACRRTRRAIEALGRRSAEYAFEVTLGQNVQVSTRQVSKDLGGLDVLVWALPLPGGGPAETVDLGATTRTSTRTYHVPELRPVLAATGR